MFIGIDSMITAVNQGDFEVYQRIASNTTTCGCPDDPLFDRGAEILRNGAAEDLVYPLETCAAFQRLKDAFAITELPAPTGLLFMPALNFDLLCDGFLIRHLRRMQRHLNVVPIGELL